LSPFGFVFFLCWQIKKESRKNSSLKKRFRWADLPGGAEGAENLVVQTLSVILPALGFLSRFLGPEKSGL
jgi:hypothetical protein